MSRFARRPSRRAAVSPSAELAEPGTFGRLELAWESEEDGPLEYSGDYVYVGMVRGLHVFAPAHDEPVVYAHRHQVVSFRALTLVD